MAQWVGSQSDKNDANTLEIDLSTASLDSKPIGKYLHFERGREIYGVGSEPRYWYQIVTGTVCLTTLLFNGGRHVVRFYYSGECFGFEPDFSRTFSAEAVDQVTVCRHPLLSVRQLIASSPGTAHELWQNALKELAHARLQTVALGRMKSPMRIVSFLLDVYLRQRSRLLYLPMRRGDIADHVGLTPETVCRILSRYVELGLIAIPNVRQIELLDVGGLEAIIEDEVGAPFGDSGRRDIAERKPTEFADAPGRFSRAAAPFAKDC